MVIGKQSEKLTKVPTQTEGISFKITNLILCFNRQQSVNLNKRTEFGTEGRRLRFQYQANRLQYQILTANLLIFNFYDWKILHFTTIFQRKLSKIAFKKIAIRQAFSDIQFTLYQVLVKVSEGEINKIPFPRICALVLDVMYLK